MYPHSTLKRDVGEFSKNGGGGGLKNMKIKTQHDKRPPGSAGLQDITTDHEAGNRKRRVFIISDVFSRDVIKALAKFKFFYVFSNLSQFIIIALFKISKV